MKIYVKHEEERRVMEKLNEKLNENKVNELVRTKAHDLVLEKKAEQLAKDMLEKEKNGITKNEEEES